MEILDALAQGGELEWYARRPSRDATEKGLTTPPVIVWRYKKPDEHREGVIQKAVESFKGKIDWLIYFGGRNWVISSRRLRDFIEQSKIRVDVEGMRMLAEQDPAFGQKANRELPKLAEHISRALGLRKQNRLPLLRALEVGVDGAEERSLVAGRQRLDLLHLPQELLLG